RRPREGIATTQAPLAMPSQRLHAPDDGPPATDAAECPEWQVARIAGQITKGHVARQCGEIVNRPEHPSVDPSLAVQRIVEQAAVARDSTISNPRHTVARSRETVPCVVDDREAIELLVVGPEPVHVREALLDGI